MRTATLLSFILVLAFSPLFFVNQVHAESGNINLLEIPQWFGEKLGITTWQAGILASLIVLAIPMFPLVILKRGKGMLFELILGIGLLCFLTAIGWFPIYAIILIILAIAGLNAKAIRDLVT